MSGLNFLSQDHSVPFLSFCVVFLSQEYVLGFPRWNQTCCAACSGVLGHSTCTLFFQRKLRLSGEVFGRCRTPLVLTLLLMLFVCVGIGFVD